MDVEACRCDAGKLAPPPKTVPAAVRTECLRETIDYARSKADTLEGFAAVDTPRVAVREREQAAAWRWVAEYLANTFPLAAGPSHG